MANRIQELCEKIVNDDGRADRAYRKKDEDLLRKTIESRLKSEHHKQRMATLIKKEQQRKLNLLGKRHERDRKQRKNLKDLELKKYKDKIKMEKKR